MRFIEFIVKRKILIGLIFVFIVVAGILSTSSLDKKLLPTQVEDGVIVNLAAGNLDALQIEEEIVTPLEKRFSSIEGFERMSTNIQVGNSTVQVFFDEGKGEEGLREIQAIMNTHQQQLTGLEDFSAIQLSTDQPYEFFMEMSNGNLDEMTRFASDILKPRLEELQEVREVDISGLKEYEAIVELDKDQLTEYNLEPTYISNLIQITNNTSTVGTLSDEENTPLLRWDTTYSNTEELKSLSIPTQNGNISLDDIATVSVQPINKITSTWKEGDSNLLLIQIGRVSDVTQIDMADAVRSEIQAIRDEGLVDGFELNEIVAQSDYVESSINGVQSNILIGGLVALVILILFLRNLRATTIIGLSIPSSILLTFVVMNLFHYSLNIVSLIALGLGIGMIVDSSIVILESIYRKKEQGLTKYESVIQGTKEVASAVIASMLTTIVVFLPIGFLGGEVGQVVTVLSIVVAIALTSSVVVSFTLIPTFSEKFLKVKPKRIRKKERRIVKFYSACVSWLLQKIWRRISVLILFVMMFIGTMTLVTNIPMNVMPDIYNRYAELVVTLESGLSQEKTEETVDEISNRLSNVTDIETHYVIRDTNYLLLLVNMTKDENITRDQKEVNEEILGELRELQNDYPISNIASALSAGGGSPVQVTVQGEDFQELDKLVAELTGELNKVEGIVGITNTNKNKSETKQIVLKQDNIQDDGLTSSQIKQFVEQLSFEIPMGTIATSTDDTTPLKLTLDDSLLTENQLMDMEIPTLNGEKVLSNYISLETRKSPNQITHEDGIRSITVSADIEGRDLGSVNRDVQNVIESLDTPESYEVSLAGDLEAQQESMNEMLIVLATAIFLVYCVMAVQFNHLAQPLIVMSVIPMTFVGAILGLLMTNQELNMISGVGLLVLIGIILNNAILLLDRTNQLRKTGQPIKYALVEAGKNRIRPIFMTTFTTAGGMLPLALATGTAGNFQSPLAIVVIFGLLFGTLITLILVPSVYMLFHDVRQGLKKIFKRSEHKDVSIEN
ncbi:efflux RND transporter permease subunit [Salinibacillus xinjiangensis]|nr:efflux RND transporter permease subunit [Salinibacillus xinjiangensis]